MDGAARSWSGIHGTTGPLLCASRIATADGKDTNSICSGVAADFAAMIEAIDTIGAVSGG